MIFMVVLRQVVETLELINDEITLARAGGDAVILIYQSLLLKAKIMKQFLVVALIYFFYELIVNGIYTSFKLLFNWSSSPDANLNPYPALWQHSFDLIFLIVLLAVLRPRHWPLFFNLGLLDEMEELELILQGGGVGDR